MKVMITAYKEHLVFTTTDEKCDDFLPAGEGRIGCLLHNPTERLLGISSEAMELLGRIPKSNDDIGDVDCFMSGEEWNFGWLGGELTTKPVGEGHQLSGSKTWDIEMVKRMPHAEIPNDVPEGAREAIDEKVAELAGK